MTNIYNTRTKRKRFGCKWAPKGKYWYKPGNSAKYYPKNGWKKSFSNSRGRRWK